MQGLINIKGFVLFCNKFAITFLFVFIYFILFWSPNYDDHFIHFSFTCYIWHSVRFVDFVGRGRKKSARMWKKARDCVSSEGNVTVPDHLLYIQPKHTHIYPLDTYDYSHFCLTFIGFCDIQWLIQPMGDLSSYEKQHISHASISPSHFPLNLYCQWMMPLAMFWQGAQISL